jgi:hypothetical protein
MQYSLFKFIKIQFHFPMLYPPTNFYHKGERTLGTFKVETLFCPLPLKCGISHYSSHFFLCISLFLRLRRVRSENKLRLNVTHAVSVTAGREHWIRTAGGVLA